MDYWDGSSGCIMDWIIGMDYWDSLLDGLLLGFLAGLIGNYYGF